MTKREAADRLRRMGRRLAIETFLMVVTGLIFGIIGPFGTFEIPLVPRVLLWILMILAGYPIFRALGTVASWLAENHGDHARVGAQASGRAVGITGAVSGFAG